MFGRRSFLYPLAAALIAVTMLWALPVSLYASPKSSGDASTGTYTYFWKDYRFRVWTAVPPFKAGSYQKIWLKIDRKAKGKWWYITLAQTYGKVFQKGKKVGITGFGLLERKRGLYLGRFKLDKKGRYILVVRMDDHGKVHEFEVPFRAH